MCLTLFTKLYYCFITWAILIHSTSSHPSLSRSISMFSPLYMGRDSLAGTATHYGLNGPRIEPRWGTRFSTPIQTSLGSTQPPVQRVLCFFPGGKVARAWHWPSTPSSAEVKRRVELCHYSSGPSWPVLGWIYLLPYLPPISRCSPRLFLSHIPTKLFMDFFSVMCVPHVTPISSILIWLSIIYVAISISHNAPHSEILSSFLS